MKKLLLLFIALMLSCTATVTDLFPTAEFYYVNKSNHNIIISAVLTSEFESYRSGDSIVASGDTIRMTKYTGGSPFGDSAQVTIIFDLIKCLKYTDSIDNDSSDIRCPLAYNKIIDRSVTKFYFEFTDSLYNLAEECN